MTGYQDPNNPMQTLQKPKKGWFARSWWWFLPLIIGGPILCCCGGVGLMGYFAANQVTAMIEDSQEFKDAITQLESNPEVVSELGTPITIPSGLAFMRSAKVNERQVGSSTIADVRLPIQGPNGSGFLVFEAEDKTGNGDITFLELYFENEAGDRIDLEIPEGLNGGGETEDEGDGGDTDAEADVDADAGEGT